MNIDELATAWKGWKEREDAARLERVAIEELILTMHPAREEGSETFITPAGAKITTTGKVTYKVDIDQLVALTGAWPAEARPYRTKVEADDAKLRVIRQSAPRMWADIATAIETKPAKTGVAIKFKE